MQSVDINTAMHLVQANTVNRVTIQCYDGQRWAILLHGRADFVLRSDRQNPRSFAKVETAMGEIRRMGLRHAAIDFEKWSPDQKTL